MEYVQGRRKPRHVAATSAVRTFAHIACGTALCAILLPSSALPAPFTGSPSVSGYPVRFTIFCSRTDSAWRCESGRTLFEFKDARATIYLDSASDVPPAEQFGIIKDLLELDQSQPSGYPFHAFFDQVEFSVRAMSPDRVQLDSNHGVFVMVRRCQLSGCRYKLDSNSSTFPTP